MVDRWYPKEKSLYYVRRPPKGRHRTRGSTGVVRVHGRRRSAETIINKPPVIHLQCNNKVLCLRIYTKTLIL